MLSLASKSGGWKFEVGCWTPGKEIDEAKEVEEAEEATQASGGKQGVPPPLFCKCVKRKGFKSFVLKVCESKGFADVFLGKCVKLKRLGAMWGLLGICDRSFGSLRSLPSCLRASRTTISGFRSPVDSTGV